MKVTLTANGTNTTPLEIRRSGRYTVGCLDGATPMTAFGTVTLNWHPTDDAAASVPVSGFTQTEPGLEPFQNLPQGFFYFVLTGATVGPGTIDAYLLLAGME